MAKIPGTVTLSGIIAPSDDQDEYAVTEDIWNKGGHRSVDTLADRDAIPTLRKKEGMTVYVGDTQITYQWVSGAWVDFVGGSGGDKTYIHTQGTASATWTVTHGLGKRTSVTVVDTGSNTVEGDVLHVDNDNVVLTFSAPFTGQAFFN
ncbi:MAG: hypothetical protein DRQ39_02210 [Gammaproteobacteria bacterium]|nr:MAG: hypothetical protein DRQ39_02210 [Gammaproteobacteria bacterium]